MMKETDTYKRICNIIERYSGDTIKKECRLYDLGLDSLDIIEFIVAIESEFDVALTDREIKNIKTVNDVFLIIQDKKLVKNI